MNRVFAISSVACLLAALSGCGNKSDSASSGSASADSSAKSSSSGSSAAGAAELPKDVDATVVAELKKLGPCVREEGYRKDGCAAAEGWDKFVEKFIEEDDLNLTKQKKLAKACFSLVADANDNIREAAYECLSTYDDGVEDKKAVISVILSKIEGETSDAIRSSMLSALDDMDPPKNGGSDQVLALAKKLEPRDDASFTVGRLVQVLTPESKDSEPTAEAFAFAVEQLGKQKQTSQSADLLAAAKSKGADACKALIGLVETKKGSWAYGMNAMANIEGGCKENNDKVVDVVVAKAAEPDGYDKGFRTSDALYLGRLVDKAGFSAEQKGKLQKAIEPVLKNAKDDGIKKTYQSLLDQLK
ncbi:MAG: hypothetical protein HOW73_23700 [Polyangiaceae bacterium]|nr:hypothetical protein [Polyangiaceae bacterium]